jgi:tetratricopeptide (TPR) repeat protein
LKKIFAVVLIFPLNIIYSLSHEVEINIHKNPLAANYNKIDKKVISNPGSYPVFDSTDIKLRTALQAYEIAKKNNSLTEQAKALNSLAKICKIKSDYEKALNYYLLALKVRQKLGDKKYLAQAFNNIGLTYANLGQFEKALENYQESYKIKRELRDSAGIGILLNNIANIKFRTGNYEEAIQYFQQALDIFEKIDSKEGITSCLNGCGLVFENLMNYEKALEYYNRAIKIAGTLKNKKQYADILNNIGNVYTTSKDFKKAIDFYNEGLEIRKELNDQQGIASSLNNIGLIYKSRKEYKEAIRYFEQALEINEKLKNNYETGLNLNAIGNSYLELHQYENALKNVNRSLRIAEKNDIKILMQLNYDVLSDIYSNLSQYDKSLAFYKRTTAMKDTLENIEIRKKINEFQTKYETEKKEHDFQILSKKNEIQKLQLGKTRIFVFGLIFLIPILIFIGILIIRQFRLKSEHKSVMLEQKLLRSQMNPHFIFNSLTSIQSFIFDEDKLLAGKYIADFAALMRLILENSREEFIILEKEINTLKYYLELQKLRYENKFDYSIFVDSSLNPEFDVIPPMLGQPFVENSIKHGIVKKETKGQIDIRLIKKDRYLVFEIEDNGIGREKAQQVKDTESSKHISLALSITRERLENINSRNSKKINFEIIDLVKNGQPSGTLVAFKIPLS